MPKRHSGPPTIEEVMIGRCQTKANSSQFPIDDGPLSRARAVAGHILFPNGLLAMRGRMVLSGAEGVYNKRIAVTLRVVEAAVGKGHARARRRWIHLLPEPASGAVFGHAERLA